MPLAWRREPERSETLTVRHCGIALQSRDASLVSFSDKAELDRVRDSFLKKKLGLAQPDEELDGAIQAVRAKMKDARNKNRVTSGSSEFS